MESFRSGHRSSTFIMLSLVMDRMRLGSKARAVAVRGVPSSIPSRVTSRVSIENPCRWKRRHLLRTDLSEDLVLLQHPDERLSVLVGGVDSHQAIVDDVHAIRRFALPEDHLALLVHLHRDHGRQQVQRAHEAEALLLHQIALLQEDEAE
eukprot:scaffold2808_cov255-Pinguiococcus_pyrenoidosus.AAC.23